MEDCNVDMVQVIAEKLCVKVGAVVDNVDPEDIVTMRRACEALKDLKNILCAVSDAEKNRVEVVLSEELKKYAN